MAHAKQPIKETEFKKIWLEQILPKFTKYVDVKNIDETSKKAAAASGKLGEELTHFLEKELPVLIYSASVAQELRPEKPGALKLIETISSVGRSALGRGFGGLVPYIIHLIQPAVIALYQKQIESTVDKFDKQYGFNIEKWLEDRTGIKLDSGDKAVKAPEMNVKPSLADLAAGKTG